MLSLLAALILSGSVPARADDTRASQARPATPPAIDPADADGDGVVSGKERRQARRAERRARRQAERDDGSSADGVDEGSSETDAMTEKETTQAVERGDTTSSQAQDMAESLRKSMTSLDATGGFPGSGAAAGAVLEAGKAIAPHHGPLLSNGTPVSAQGGKNPAGFPPGKASGDPAHPTEPSDFLLTARSGYAPALAASGLKLSADGRSIVRLDGKPATAEDYARLQHQVSMMPAAISRRPDFFSVVSPGHYSDLKREYPGKKDDPAFKDVGTTPDERDFVHTASCTKISGDCNENSENESYKKGDFVAPEDLDNMWDALQKELDASSGPGEIAGLLASASSARSAGDKGLQMALSLTEGGKTSKESSSEAVRMDGAAPTPIKQAAASIRRLWRSAVSVAAPGEGEVSKGGPGPLAAVAALAAAGLAAGALLLRRRS